MVLQALAAECIALFNDKVCEIRRVNGKTLIPNTTTYQESEIIIFSNIPIMMNPMSDKNRQVVMNSVSKNDELWEAQIPAIDGSADIVLDHKTDNVYVDGKKYKIIKESWITRREYVYLFLKRSRDGDN